MTFHFYQSNILLLYLYFYSGRTFGYTVPRPPLQQGRAQETALLLFRHVGCDWAVPLTGSSLSKKQHHLSKMSTATYKKSLIKCEKRNKTRMCRHIPREVSGCTERAASGSLNRTVAFRLNADQARPKDGMCTVGMTHAPKWISSQKSSHANRRAETMPKRSREKLSEEKYNAGSRAAGLVARGQAFSRAHYRSFPITVSAHPASRSFSRRCLDSTADVPEFGSWEDELKEFMFEGNNGCLAPSGSREAVRLWGRGCNTHQERREVGWKQEQDRCHCR